MVASESVPEGGEVAWLRTKVAQLDKGLSERDDRVAELEELVAELTGGYAAERMAKALAALKERRRTRGAPESSSELEEVDSSTERDHRGESDRRGRPKDNVTKGQEESTSSGQTILDSEPSSQLDDSPEQPNAEEYSGHNAQPVQPHAGASLASYEHGTQHAQIQGAQPVQLAAQPIQAAAGFQQAQLQGAYPAQLYGAHPAQLQGAYPAQFYGAQLNPAQLAQLAQLQSAQFRGAQPAQAGMLSQQHLSAMHFKPTDSLLPKGEDLIPKQLQSLRIVGPEVQNSQYQRLATDVPTHEDGDEEHEEGERKFTLVQAIALNTLMMFGTGPFITIPFCIASTEPAGPQALIGYAVAGLACVCDSFIWAELGALYPHSGGSYVYLQKCIGDKWGRYLSFLFLWQLLITGPMEVASGFIAIAQYLAYITQTYTFAHHSLVAFAFCVTCIILLYRDMKDVGSTTVVLWIGMCAAIAFTLVAGFTHFETENLAMPEIKSSQVGALIWSLGNAARFGIYDFTGYYDVNFIGKEVQNPTRTIPVAGIVTCCVVCVVYFATYIAVMAYLPWNPDEGGYVGLVESGGNSAAYIMSIFCEKMIGRGFAIFFTLVVIYCIYGSCFSLMLGFAQIPYAASKNGMFYKYFAHENTRGGFADYSLLFMGALSCVFCFVDLAIVIEGMMTTTICTMFLANSLALVVHRKRFPDMERPYTMPLYPLPVIVQVAMFSFVFLTSDNYFIMGSAPLLECGMLFLLAGSFAFLIQSKAQGKWPFEKDGEPTNPSKNVIMPGGPIEGAVMAGGPAKIVLGHCD